MIRTSVHFTSRALTDREAEEHVFITQAAQSQDIDDPGMYDNTEGAAHAKLGEGRRTLSWIWFSVQVSLWE
jgi:hypothetical protein